MLHVAKVLEFQLQHQSFSEYSGLISFMIDWFDLLIVQGTQESSLTLQFKSIDSSALRFLMVKLSHSYMTTGKTIAFARWTL